MIGIVIGNQQDGAQVGLPILAGRNRRKQIEVGIQHQLLQPLAIGSEVLDAPVPGTRIGRRGALGPVVVRPIERVDVSRVRGEVEEVLLRDPDVLEQLPRRVLEARGARSTQVRRDPVDRLVESDVGFIPVEEANQLIAEGLFIW